MRMPLLPALVLAAAIPVAGQQPQRPDKVIRFAFTSDAHYGLTRSTFRGHTNVPAREVNAALVAHLNTLNELVGPVDFAVEGGDVANRAEADDRIQSAAASWAQFRNDYLNHLTLRTSSGGRTPIYVVPGNHDASNAIGFYRPMRLSPTGPQWSRSTTS